MIRIIGFLIIFVSSLFADTRITEENLQSGDLFEGSLSSHDVGLYCIHRGLTTATQMVLMSKAKEKILATIPIRTTYSIPKERKNWLTVQWTPNGKMVAIHDSLSRHSKVLIYRQNEDGTFSPVALPDMLKLEGGGRLGLDVASITSSGQEPDRWRNDNLLMVKYRFKTKSGQLYRRTLPITVDKSGTYQPQ